MRTRRTVALAVLILAALTAARVHHWPSVMARAARGTGAAEGRAWVTAHGGRIFTVPGT